MRDRVDLETFYRVGAAEDEQTLFRLMRDRGLGFGDPRWQFPHTKGELYWNFRTDAGGRWLGIDPDYDIWIFETESYRLVRRFEVKGFLRDYQLVGNRLLVATEHEPNGVTEYQIESGKELAKYEIDGAVHAV